MCMSYVYIYIYNMYVYIYTHTHYIYIPIYVDSCREPLKLAYQTINDRSNCLSRGLGMIQLTDLRNLRAPASIINRQR